MAEQALKLMTVDEFLVWEDGTGTRYELSSGTARAMAPASDVHARIAGNTIVLIGVALRSKRPCKVHQEAGVRVDERTWWQADMAVTCSPASTSGEVDQPTLVVEVLSPTTRTHDLGRKLDDYKALPSVQEVWMVDSQRRWLQLWRREAEGWVAQDLVGGAVFDSQVLGISMALDEVYDLSGL